MSFIKKAIQEIQRLINTREFLHEKVSLSECQNLIREGINNREDNFLIFFKKIIYENKKNPYLELLKLSHISFEDIERMVKKKGIEETLYILKNEGVYVTFEEFKEKRTVKRKGKTFYFKKEDFSNPIRARMGEIFSGASRGPARELTIGIEYLMQKLVHEAVVFDLHRIMDAPLALWYPPFPSNVALYPLRLQKLGLLPKVWFSQINPAVNNPSLSIKIFLFKKNIKNIFLKPKYPFPQYVSLKDAYIVAQWASEMINKYSMCSIHTYVSSAVRVCAVAKETGLNIAGTRFFISGEPLTERKRMEIEGTGCKTVNTYYFTEGGLAGCNCDNPLIKTDDIHFFKDSFALIQHIRETQEHKLNLFLFTSFYQGCPIIMLNMENGDYGVIEKKNCGCLLDQYGFFDHIYNIRSIEKICSEGMTFYTKDIIDIVEEEFPKKFGGSSIDFQIVEEEDKDGLTHLYIYVNPEIKDINERLAKQILFDRLRPNINRSVRIKFWEEADTFRIIKAYPFETPRGKILPFYQNLKNK